MSNWFFCSFFETALAFPYVLLFKAEPYMAFLQCIRKGEVQLRLYVFIIVEGELAVTLCDYFFFNGDAFCRSAQNC